MENAVTDEAWRKVRETIEDVNLVLGPYFASQALKTPRHLLFTLARYKFAAKMLAPGTASSVLELGCGEGLGTLLLAEGENDVTGVDFDDAAIAHAQAHIDIPNCRFLHGAFLGKTYGAFDAVVSIDVVEHIAKERENEFLETLVGNLGPNGIAVVGTPNQTASKYASEASEIGHVNLFTGDRFDAFLRAGFHNVFLFSMNDEVVHTGFHPMAHYLMALACGPRKAANGD